jgi:hypothetical protein
MAAYLSPVFGAGAQLFSNAGIVLSGGKIYTYLAGTTTPQATWTDSTQAVANANPIILDSAGRPTSEIWLQAGLVYKFILTDSNNNTLGTWDNVSGVNDVSFTGAVSEWQASLLTPTYISSTSFSVPGNNVALFQVNRRLQITVTAGTIYAYVVSSSFGGGITTIVVQPDSTAIDSGISAVNVALLNSLNPSTPQQLPQMNAPVSVVSASPITAIGAATSANVTITGVVTIIGFDNVLAGIIRFVKFSGILTLTHNGTSLILPGGVNIITAAGDQALFRSLGSGNWECLNYVPMTFSSYPTVSDQLSITCTQASSSLTCGLDPCIIRFRSATLTTGQPNTRVIFTGISLVVPNGATLGTPTTKSSRIALVAIDNAGTIEEAVVYITLGSVSLDESALISTTAISVGATSANVFYSTTARTNVPFKVIGYFDVVNTAGAWSTPTLVQSAGGNSVVGFVVTPPNLQVFTANGTWTKPALINPNALIQIEAWGAGGGGSNANDGGGGGGYSTIILKASSFGATETVTIGTGGTSGTTGVTGGNSSLGSLLTAYGGAGGKSGSGGGGGGGTGGAGGNGKVGGIAAGIASITGFYISEVGGSTNGATPQGQANVYGGGCGGQTGSGYGGGSFYGGGGGSADTAPAGGISTWGGAGGASGAAGVAPGGGGGLNGAGARGEVWVRVLG